MPNYWELSQAMGVAVTIVILYEAIRVLASLEKIPTRE